MKLTTLGIALVLLLTLATLARFAHTPGQFPASASPALMQTQP